jgi:tetratricopeptide (TPR) repeat protein
MSVVSARAVPSKFPEHVPFLNNQQAQTVDLITSAMFNRADYLDSSSLFEEMLEMSLLRLTELPAPAAPSGPISVERQQAILDVVYSRFRLGMVRFNIGDLVDAQFQLEQGVALAEATVGPTHHRLAESLAELGWVLIRRGRFQQAESILERALAMREKLLGPDHSDVSMTLTYLGKSCVDQGNYKKAKALLKRAVAIAELHLVPNEYPKELCPALNQLSHIYCYLKEYVRAQKSAERALALYEQFLGPNHPNTAVAVIKLAACFEGQGKFSEAEPMYERAVEIYERMYGPNHSEVATTLANLGNMLRQKGDYAKAKTIVERALAIDEKEFGPNHLHVAHSLHNLANICGPMGNVARAKSLYQRALTIYETQLGRTHPSTAEILRRLAEVAVVTGKPRQAAVRLFLSHVFVLMLLVVVVVVIPVDMVCFFAHARENVTTHFNLSVFVWCVNLLLPGSDTARCSRRISCQTTAMRLVSDDGCEGVQKMWQVQSRMVLQCRLSSQGLERTQKALS